LTVVERTWRQGRKLGHGYRDSKPVAKPDLTVQMCAKPLPGMPLREGSAQDHADEICNRLCRNGTPKS
jgi:hypothetical protein